MVNISFEFFPPKTPEGDAVLWKAVEAFVPLKPAFCSVTYGAGGSTKDRTAEVVKRIQQETGIPSASHLTCVNAPKAEIDAIARQYWADGIRRIVALRGDMPGMAGKYVPHPEGYAYAHELVTGLKRIAGFDISVACFPETHPDAVSPEADIEYLKRKVDAGADRAITQYCFDTDKILSFIEKARKAGVSVPILPGVMPIQHFKQAVSFSERCGASVPDWLHARFAAVEGDAAAEREVAIEVATEQCQKLLESGLEELHFYSLNKAEPTLSVCRNIGAVER